MSIDPLLAKFSIPNVDRVIFQLRYFPNFMASNFKVEPLPKGMPEQCIVGKLDGTPVRAEDCEHLRASITNIVVECLNDADSEVFHKVIPYKAIVIRDSQYEVEIVSDYASDSSQGIASLVSLLYPSKNYLYAYTVKVTVTKARTWSRNYRPFYNTELSTDAPTFEEMIRRKYPGASVSFATQTSSAMTQNQPDTKQPLSPAEPVKPKGYTSVGMDITGGSARSNAADMFASIVAEATKHVNNVKEGNTPALKVESDDAIVTINATGKEVEKPSKEAVDKYVKNSLEEAKAAFADKMRQSLQEAKDEGMKMTAERGDAIAEDDFDFEKKS